MNADRLLLFIGAATTAAGISVQSIATAGGAHSFALQMAGIVLQAISAGCLSASPSIRNGIQKGPPA